MCDIVEMPKFRDHGPMLLEAEDMRRHATKDGELTTKNKVYKKVSWGPECVTTSLCRRGGTRGPGPSSSPLTRC
jgi:hypothetical protein